MWTDKDTGGTTDGQFWKIVPHPGYVALNDVAIHTPNSQLDRGTRMEPDKINPIVMCVHESLVERPELGRLLWTNVESGGKYDGAIWEIDDLLVI